MWSYEQFVAEGAELVARSQKPRRQPQRGDGCGNEQRETTEWQWRHGKRPHLPGNSFLVSLGNPRRQKPRRSDDGPTKQCNEGDALADINALLEEDDNELSDPVSLLQENHANEEEEETVLFDFHIVFHAVYQAPVLYFRLTRLDGSPIAFHDSSIARDLHLPGSDTRTPLVAMEDHQVLGTPFYFLHPCETASAMELLLDQPARSNSYHSINTSAVVSGSDSERRTEPTYLLAWLSLVQPLTSIDPQMY